MFSSSRDSDRAVGDVVEQRDQEFRLALFVARDHAVGGDDALSRSALDHEFAAELAFRRIERRPVRRLDAGWLSRTEDLVGALADDVVAREAREPLERAVGENIAAVLDVLGGDADRNVVEHRFQKLRGRCKLARQLALLGAILMRRDRPAVRQRKMFDQDRSAVGQFGDQAFRAGGVVVELIDADVERRRACAASPAVPVPVMLRERPSAPGRRFPGSDRCRTRSRCCASVITTPWLRLFRAELTKALRRSCERLTLRNAVSTQSPTAARKDATAMPPISSSQIRLGSSSADIARRRKA